MGDQQQPDIDPKTLTTGGRWIKRDVDVHRCPLPAYNSSVRRHDLWECGKCHKVHVVTKIESDQREGNNWITWAEHESWKSGPYPHRSK